jgi:CD2 antigen cytoplasmic tail-binding protein 2
MPVSANGDKKKGVRFAVRDGDDHRDDRREAAPGVERRSPRADDDPSSSSKRAPPSSARLDAGRKTKRPRPEYNVDELDDVDDWRPEDDEDEEAAGTGAVSDHALQEAKRMRRLRRAGQDDLDDDDDDEHHHGEQKVNGWDTAGASLLKDDDERDNNGGVAITPFSMEEEENDGTGYFDGDTYVFRHKRGDDEEPDAWADALDEESNDAGVSKVSRKRTDEARSGADETTSAASLDDWTEQDLYARILPLVSDSETITAAIVRYGNLIKRETKRGDGTASNGAGAPTATGVGDAASLRATEALNELTEASSALLLKGQVDIYQKTRADLLLLLPDSSKISPGKETEDVPRQAPAREQVVQWEYMGNEDKQIHGPFKSEQMLQWISAGWFVGPSAVQVRPIYEKPRQPSLQDDLMNDLMDDDGEKDGQDAKSDSDTELSRGEWQQSDQVDFSQFCDPSQSR